jgi:hypothetical protein
LCGKHVKDLARHMKRLHATATDSDRDDDAADERKQWQARLEAAEQAEQKAADLARRAQRENALAEAKAMAASAPVAAASPVAAEPPFAAPASAVVKEQQDAGAAPDDSIRSRAPSPEDVDPASSSADASEQPFSPAAVLLPADLEKEQSQHGMSLAWTEHEDTHASWQRSHQQRQWAREQVAHVGRAIQTHMVGALSSQAMPSSAAIAALDGSSLQTTLSFAPGRESAALAPLQAVALYQDQSRFGRKIGKSALDSRSFPDLHADRSDDPVCCWPLGALVLCARRRPKRETSGRRPPNSGFRNRTGF